MKRATLLGMLVLTTPMGGCALLPYFDTPPMHVAAPHPDAAGSTPDLESVLREAQAVRKSGDLPAAAKMLGQLVLVAPDDARVLGEYGKTLAAEGRSDDALAFLERAIELQPADWSLLSAQGVAYDQKGNYHSAQLSYARALSLKPGDPTVLNNDALSHMQSGDLDGAEALLRQATPGTPDYPRLAQNLALVQRLRAVQSANAGATTPVPAQPPAMTAEPSPMPASMPKQVPMAASVAAPTVVSVPVIMADLPALAPPALAIAAEPPTVVEQTEALPRQLSVTSDASAPPKAVENNLVVPAKPMEAPAPVSKGPESSPHPLIVKSETPALPKPADNKLAERTPEPKSLPGLPEPASKPVYVQAGAYLTEKRAEEAASDLDSLGAHVMTGVVNGRSVYRVRIGPFLTVHQAKAAFLQAQLLGRSDLNIVRD